MVEVAWARDSMTSARLVKAKRDSIERSKKEKLLPQTVAVLVLAYGHTGPLPGSKMPESIIDEVATDHVIDGPLTLGDRWLRSQDLASVKDVVELRTLLGIRNITKESA